MIRAVVLLLSVAAPAAAPGDTLRDAREVRQSVLRHADDVRGCYEREGLRRDATLEGTLELELTILPTGEVGSARTRAAALRGAGAAEVGACVAQAAQNWRFERGPYAVHVVIFPFVLRAERPAAADPPTPAPPAATAPR